MSTQITSCQHHPKTFFHHFKINITQCNIQWRQTRCCRCSTCTCISQEKCISTYAKSPPGPAPLCYSSFQTTLVPLAILIFDNLHSPLQSNYGVLFPKWFWLGGIIIRIQLNHGACILSEYYCKCLIAANLMIFLWYILNVRYFLAQEQGEGNRLVMKAFWLI